MKKLAAICFVSVLLIGIVSFAVKKTAMPVANKTSASALTIGLNLGNEAPEIALQDPSGKVIKLSSLRGKMVLIDFWASWCGPCRHENPTVVKAYNDFKTKKLGGSNGFTVYSVSLDVDAGAWKQAIAKDGLDWEYHVSDLMGWSSQAAAQYAVTGIPINFLINEKGIIINKNLRGSDLINALTKLVVEK